MLKEDIIIVMEENKKIIDAGIKKGKLLFFGGVYCNLQALEALRRWAFENNYQSENIFCTGDVLGYCAQPLECIECVKDWGIQCIAGNVELQIRNNSDDCGCDFSEGGRCDLFSKNWYAFAKSKMDEASFSWLNSLPDHIQFKYGNKKIFLVHGSFPDVSAFIFMSTPRELKATVLEQTNADIIIAGHCGLPFADHIENKIWLNAGAIGMPANDGTSRVWFLTLDTNEHDALKYSFHSITYDHSLTAQLMLQNHLPGSYAKTLSTGIWDNCEILPTEEILLQGIKIECKQF